MNNPSFLFTKEEYENAKFDEMLLLKCSFCNKQFTCRKKNIHERIRKNLKTFCSLKCVANTKRTQILCSCHNCGKEYKRIPTHIKKYKHSFCSQSCTAKWNNTHRTKGNSISKLEKWLQSKLINLYPNIDFVFNQNTAIGVELDIYIPSLQLAFELNGIFHYEPIFGPEKLNSVQNRDQKRYHLCIANQIDLCVIDTTKQKIFKESTSQIYLDIIANIINDRSG